MPSTPNAGLLERLDSRARDIFREIVEQYIATGEPVGSRTVSRLGGVHLSPASIRNTMADLADLGLLDAPHISSGRIPTHAGLRLFVDGFMEVGALSEAERREIEHRIGRTPGGVAEVLNEASELLSGFAGGAGLVASPAREAKLKHVELVQTGPGEALVILVGDDGDVENRLIATPPGMTAASLIEATNFLNARLKGRTLAETKEAVLEEVRRDRASLDTVAARLVQDGLADWGGGEREHRALIVRGRANLLQDHGAFADLERVRRLFDDLERKSDLIQILDLARDAKSVRIFIGAENPLFSLSGSSMIIAPYANAGRKVMGALGVIGPTRLNYARVIPVVDYTARVLGKVLEERARKPQGDDR
jgi:heat-inducible transcriptional repressor